MFRPVVRVGPTIVPRGLRGLTGVGRLPVPLLGTGGGFRSRERLHILPVGLSGFGASFVGPAPTEAACPICGRSDGTHA